MRRCWPIASLGRRRPAPRASTPSLPPDEGGVETWFFEEEGHALREVTSSTWTPGSSIPGHDVLVSRVSEATPADVTSWLELAREVEPLFGPMPDFESTIRRNISRGTTLCVRDA